MLWAPVRGHRNEPVDGVRDPQHVARLRFEMIGLTVLIGAYWIVEQPLVPSLLLGPGQEAVWDQAETLLLTALALVVVGPIILRTARLAWRVEELERLLRIDPWLRRVDSPPGQSVLVGTLGDGNPTLSWRLAGDDWVQSISHPELAGRVVSGRTHRAADGTFREDYEIEVPGGLRFLVAGHHLRRLPLCQGRPMQFVSADRKRSTLIYRCRECRRRSEILL